MKRLMLTVAGAALGLGMALPAQAQTADADCKTMFEAADTNKDGSLGVGENDKFVVLMSTKPKDASIVSMEEFLAECRKDAFKSVQEAAVLPAPDTNTATKSSSDTASTTAEAPAASAEATTEQSATTDQSATMTEQPAATTSQDATVTQPSAQPSATDQPAAVEQPAATASQDTTVTQPSATDQPAAVEQPAATASQDTTVSQPTTTDQSATAEQPAATDSRSPGDMLASKLIGTTVVSIDNKNIGEINDIVIDVESEQAAQAIIGVGGFLGIGEKNVAVDLKRLDVRTDINSNSWTIVLDTTEDELKQLPEYKAAAAAAN